MADGSNKYVCTLLFMSFTLNNLILNHFYVQINQHFKEYNFNIFFLE